MKLKKLAMCFVCSMLVFATALPMPVEAAKTLKELKGERDALKAKTDSAKKALEEAKSKSKSVSDEISAMDATVSATEAELNKMEADMAEINIKLSTSEIELSEAQVAKEKQLEVFGQRIKYIYESGSIGYMDVLVNSENLGDLMLRMQYVQDIMEYDNNILINLKDKEKVIQTKTEDIKNEKAESDVLLSAQQKKMKELDAVLDEKKAIVKSYEKDAEKYAQLIASNEKASEEVTALILSADGGDSGFVYTGGKLNWPVPSRGASTGSLSSGYVGRNRPIGSGTEFHTGYDIPASYGSNIVAAEAGTVITAGWVRGYGNTVIINHGGGLSTLYGHNSSVVVSVGQKVTRGQTIAKCGSTGNSTGNHCHFEVRINGKHTNPSSYLGVGNRNS